MSRLRSLVRPIYRRFVRSAVYQGLRRRWILTRFRKVDRHVVEAGGAKVTFSTEDAFSKTWFFPRYARGRLHEAHVTEHLIDRLRSSRCFADVGALVGYYACLAAKLCPRARVHAFEMDSDNVALLLRNVELNALDNVAVVEAAVADRLGTLRYAARSGGGGIFKLASFGTGIDPAKLRDVKTVSLDEHFAGGPGPDLVKIDVEGAEMLVLRGMERLLTEVRPRIFVEVHPNTIQGFGAKADDVLELLEAHGYRCRQVSPAPGHPLDPVDRPIRHNVMLYAEPAHRS